MNTKQRIVKGAERTDLVLVGTLLTCSETIGGHHVDD